MESQPNKKLLKNKKVIDEINRHRWIESEKAGHDIGFEQASTQWLEGFSKAWMQYHMPKPRVSEVRKKPQSQKRTRSAKAKKS